MMTEQTDEILERARDYTARALFPTVVAKMVAKTDPLVTALIGGAKDTATVLRWQVGSDVPGADRQSALRVALLLVYIFEAFGDDASVAAAWLIGSNNALGRSPAELLADSRPDDVREDLIAAALAFETR